MTYYLDLIGHLHYEMFEGTKEVKINPVNRRTANAMAKRKKTKRQTVIYNTLHWKLKIEKHEHKYNPGVKSDAPDG